MEPVLSHNAIVTMDSVARVVRNVMRTSANLVLVMFSRTVQIPLAVSSAHASLATKETVSNAKVRKIIKMLYDMTH
jgi:hypothetical protein